MGGGGVVANPAWTIDELIVTLDLYFTKARPVNQPFFSKGSTEVLELSQLLNDMWEEGEGPRPEKFRNPNGVYMKLMNFRSLDREHPGKGLQSVSTLDRWIWEEYSLSRDALSSLAGYIRENMDPASGLRHQVQYVRETEGVEEGQVTTQLHRSRERDSAIVEAKKVAARKSQGKLICEVCEFDFAKVYGKRGDGFIECHHIKPLSDLSPLGGTTGLSDLALVCSNCHRMIHRKSPWLSINQLKNLLAV